MLIASIGKAKVYEETTYVLKGKKCRECFSTIAIAQLLDIPKEEKILLLVTPETAEFFQEIHSRLGKSGYHNVEKIPIPHADDEENIFQIVITLTEKIPEKTSIILDVTHSFRSLPFVYFVALLFLRAFRNVEIQGIYYGSFEKDRELNPIIDLTSLFSMAFWFHAVQAFRETGNIQPLHNLVLREVSRLFQMNQNDLVKKINSWSLLLQKLGRTISYCLPLEIGLSIHELITRLNTDPNFGSYDKLISMIFDEIQKELQPMEIVYSQKSQIPLTREELKRQLFLARWYFHHGSPEHTLLILSEWLVNLALFNKGEKNWLSYQKTRGSQRAEITALSRRILYEYQEKRNNGNKLAFFGKLCNQLGTLRNNFAHVGMNDQGIDPARIEGKVEKILTHCEELLTREYHDLFITNIHERLIIIPFGLSPGVLYSAAIQSNFKALLIIFTEESRKNLLETLLEMHKQGKTIPFKNIYLFYLSDPHADYYCTKDLERVKIQSLTGDIINLPNFLISFESIEGCMTGGTTAMQYLVERILDYSRRLGIFEIRRFALIDRRSPEEQKKDPYILGEKKLLDHYQLSPEMDAI